MHPSLQLWDLEALYYSQFRDWEVRPSVRPPDRGKAAAAQPLLTSRQADSQSESYRLAAAWPTSGKGTSSHFPDRVFLV